MSEPMSPYFSVFNGHCNQADKRARAIMKAVAPESLEEVERVEKTGDGIMAVFQNSPTQALAMYVGMVTGFVNENRVDGGECQYDARRRAPEGL